MLVLSRKPGQRVCIGASVVVTVVDVHDGKVRLAFDAPAQVAIHREEIRKRSVPADQADPGFIPQGASSSKGSRPLIRRAGCGILVTAASKNLVQSRTAAVKPFWNLAMQSKMSR